jgi:hypothetical protein
VISLFKKLSHEAQDRLASLAVTRGWKTTSILRAGSHALNQSGKKHKEPVKRQVKEVVIPKGAHFDALALVTQKISVNLQNAARATCQSCPLYAEASLNVCRQCPLPDFLNRLRN